MRALLLAGPAPAAEAAAPAGLCLGALLPVANRALVLHVLDAAVAAGAEAAVVVVPPEHEAAALAVVGEDPPAVPVEFVADPGLGPAGALHAAAGALRDGPVLVHAADGLLQCDLPALAARLAAGTADALLLVHPAPPGGGAPVRGGDGVVVAGPGVALAEAALLAPGALARLGGRVPAAGDFAALAGALGRAGRAEIAPVQGWRRFEGDLRALLALNQGVLDLLETVPGPELPGCQVQGRVRVHPTACVEGTILRGPSVVGARAVVRDAYVGPYTAIGDDVHLEGAEIEHSIVLAGASITHVGGRIEASVVGRSARVFRDFALPRALRLRVGNGAEIALR